MSSGLQEKEILFKSDDARPDRIASANPADFAIPNGREEEWRYTPLKRTHNLQAEAASDTKISIEITPAQGIKHQILAKSEIKTKFLATDRIAARAESLSQEVLVIDIPANFETKDLTWVKATLNAGTQFGHIIINAGANSRGTIILEHLGEGIAALNCEVIAAPNAQIEFITVFDLERKAVLASEHHFEVDKDANVRSLAVQFQESKSTWNISVGFFSVKRLQLDLKLSELETHL